MGSRQPAGAFLHVGALALPQHCEAHFKTALWDTRAWRRCVTMRSSSKRTSRAHVRSRRPRSRDGQSDKGRCRNGLRPRHGSRYRPCATASWHRHKARCAPSPKIISPPVHNRLKHGAAWTVAHSRGAMNQIVDSRLCCLAATHLVRTIPQTRHNRAPVQESAFPSLTVFAARLLKQEKSTA